MWALLCCSCWFRLPLPLAGSKPAVTLTLALQICSVQQNLSLSLSHTYSAYSPAPIQASSFCFQYFSTLQHFSCVLGTTQVFTPCASLMLCDACCCYCCSSRPQSDGTWRGKNGFMHVGNKVRNDQRCNTKHTGVQTSVLVYFAVANPA